MCVQDQDLSIVKEKGDDTCFQRNDAKNTNVHLTVNPCIGSSDIFRLLLEIFCGHSSPVEKHQSNGKKNVPVETKLSDTLWQVDKNLSAFQVLIAATCGWSYAQNNGNRKFVGKVQAKQWAETSLPHTSFFSVCFWSARSCVWKHGRLMTAASIRVCPWQTICFEKYCLLSK